MAQQIRPDNAYHEVIACPDEVVNPCAKASRLRKIMLPWRGKQIINDSVQLHSICPICVSVSRRIAFLYEFCSSIDSGSIFPFKESLQHCTSGQELDKSQMEGCHLCGLVWSSICSLDRRDTLSKFFRRNIEEQIKGYHNSADLVRNGTTVTFRCEMEGTFGAFQITPIIDHPLTGALLGMPMEVERSPESSLGLFGLRSRFESSKGTVTADELCSALSTSSRSIVNLVRSLLDECTTSHTKCGRPSTPFLPTRLLQIHGAGPHKVKLRSTSRLARHTAYTTLSYCWGPTKPSRISLEKRTVSQFESSISLNQLPKTIREAIHFTHALGIRYIWIDLLCIIQDSEEDMAHEIAEMGKIFENGHLNISALSSSSMEQGLYAQRNPFQYCPVMIGQAENDNKLQIMPPGDWNDKLHYWPVHQRGWIFQERIFSRRTLYFGPYLVWVCHETSRHEYNREASEKYTIGPRFRQLLSQPTLTEEEKYSFYESWCEILRSFFSTHLSWQTDRLKAITGLIANIEERTKWKNIMGLWEPFLLEELLWRHKYGPSEVQPTQLKPSWSWISVQGIIRIQIRRFGDRVARLETSQPFLDDGTIVLSVSCLPFPVTSFFQYKKKLCATLEKWPALGRVTVYHDRDELPLPTLFLPLIRVGVFVHGLAIAPSTSFDGMYERVGTMEATSISVVDCDVSYWDSGEYAELWVLMSGTENWSTFPLV